MATTFPGVFAGKMTFCSTQQSGPNFYLTTQRISNGNNGWLYYPGMNASVVTQTEKFLLYLFPQDQCYRLQSGDGRWLTMASAGYLQYGDDPLQAAAFTLQGTPFGSVWMVNVGNVQKQIHYRIVEGVTNILTTNASDGDLDTLAPVLITPSLDLVRQQKLAKGADFIDAILTGQDLSGGIDFTGALFSGAQLGGVNFSGATLDQVNMSQTDLRGLNWGAPASAVGIDMTGSNATGCTFGDKGQGQNQINCSGAKLSTGNFTQANLANLNLYNAQLGGAILNGAVLDYANLNLATLNNVVAIRASFANAVLTDASAQMGNFIQAVFDNATLTRVRMGASSYLFVFTATNQIINELQTDAYPQTDLIGIFQQHGITLDSNAPVEILLPKESWQIDDPAGPYKLILTDLGIQVFNDNENLVPAILQGASLVGAQASTASLSGADLRGVRWYASPATLDHADLQDAAWEGAVLISTNFTQANLSGADFSGCVLTQANFKGCVAGSGGSRRAISFEGAHLEGADFDKATFAGAILTNAVVALNNGAPLLFLPLTDQQYLTPTGLATLAPVFKNAGFDLGSNPTVVNQSSWVIDNSQSTNPHAPKQYTVQSGTANLQVFGNGQYLFPLPTTTVAFLNQPTAVQKLVSMFASNHYTLALGAPISSQQAWNIIPDPDTATYILPYRFPKISVLPETTRLVAYGVATVLIQEVEDVYAGGIAFNATQSLDSALNNSAIGPSGVPYAWVGQQWIDEESFYTPLG